MDIYNGGVYEAVALEEAGFGPASVAALAVPVVGTTAVQSRTFGAFDGDIDTRYGEERSCPLLVLPFGGPLEDNLGRQ